MLGHVLTVTVSFVLVVSFPASTTNAHGVSPKVHRAISGRITDPNGAVVVGAKITIVGHSSRTTLVTTSNAKGQYVADLEPDTYDVTAAAPGFKTITRSTGVSRGTRSYMDFVLYPGDVGITTNNHPLTHPGNVWERVLRPSSMPHNRVCHRLFTRWDRLRLCSYGVNPIVSMARSGQTTYSLS